MASVAQQVVPLSLPNRRPISVLHLIHTMAYGGVETALINWVRKLDPAQFQVHVACFANPGATEAPFVQAAEDRGIKVLRVPWGRRKPLLKASRVVAELIRMENIDILHTHNCYADCVGAIAALRAPVKTVTTLYVWDSLDWKRNLIQFVNRYSIGSFNLITAHCEDTYRKTLKMGFAPERLRTLICGFEADGIEITSEERMRGRQAMGVAPEQVVLANIARLYPEKAQEFLLRAFAKILQQTPHARLWIVGVGPLEESLRRLSTKLSLDSAVTFVGFVKDLPSLLTLVDIQVNPSTTEGVPLAVCSGMAAGLPVVATDVGGLPEIIRHGRSGLLVRAGDESAFIESVLRLIREPGMRRLLGSEARRFMTEEYSLDAAVQRVQQAYYEVLGLCASESS